ncbi:MAG TPA: DUF2474 domain-containing protein [Rhizobiaceae bacterium]|nr:DUF2474 domain-containing protein [Rhizobiaceae bacterium]
MREPGEAPASWPRRIGWLILIWTASVLALGAVALAFRALMNLAGLTT